MEKQLFVDTVSGMDLFCTPHCRVCGELTVHGFWQQLKRFLEPGKDRVSVYLPCGKCGHVKRRRFKLVEKENLTPRPKLPTFTEMARKFEWSNKGCCPHCSAPQADGHKTDCTFAANLPHILKLDEHKE